MKRILFSLAFVTLTGSQLLAQTPPPHRPPGPSCNPEEVRQISYEVERATLDKVRRDMMAEGAVRASAVGMDDRDCLRQATDRANYSRQEAINQCVSRTTYFRSCDIQQTRVIQPPQTIQPIITQGLVDERDITEQNCMAGAQNRAVENALRSCQQQFGMGCRLVSGPTQATHRTEKRRRYGIVGPKDEYHICESMAQALPDGHARVQCAVEIVAKVRF
ncbi:MAG: hypothetical protein BroJett040_20950 [Oligoflexia bacterium]|nr:MAG: hypothetical protein BroJett040_20950 [Oligoflexia bacterium]